MNRSVFPTESQIQCAIVEWANNTNMPDWNNTKIGDFLIKNANEGKRSFSQGKKMKKEGLKKGVSDLFFAYPTPISNSKFGMWIEVKTEKGKVTPEQRDWIVLMRSIGYRGIVVRGVDEGIQAIKDYLGMT